MSYCPPLNFVCSPTFKLQYPFTTLCDTRWNTKLFKHYVALTMYMLTMSIEVAPAKTPQYVHMLPLKATLTAQDLQPTTSHNLATIHPSLTAVQHSIEDSQPRPAFRNNSSIKMAKSRILRNSHRQISKIPIFSGSAS